MFRLVSRIRIVPLCQQATLAPRTVVPFDASKVKCGSLNYARLSSRNGSRGAFCELQSRALHVSATRRALPPVIVILLRPVAQLGAILFGRTLRKWWKALPPERKQKLLRKMKRNRNVLVASSVLAASGFMWYYSSHLTTDPLTGRRKFVVFTNEQVLQVAELELEMQLEQHKGHFLPPSHPAFQRVSKVANHILRSNKNLKQLHEKKWVIAVVDEPSVQNAFVLPSGHIFIFTGMLDMCTNDDQLCVILSHELSHVLLSHAAEQMSNLHLADMLVLLPLALIWAVLPDAAALLAQWLSGYFTKLLFHLPFSRTLESEADEIGLLLTAKACYDVREASAFWAKMHTKEPQFEWLSTHPSNETRQIVLDALIPLAIKLRDECQCPKLPLLDPRKYLHQDSVENKQLRAAVQ